MLYVRGLNFEQLKVGDIFNLLGCYGNVVMLELIRSKGSALAEFETEEQAGQAKEFLHSQYLFGSRLKVFFSHLSSLQERLSKLSANPAQDFFLGNPLTYRFKPKRAAKLNQVSPYLYLSHESALREHPCRFALIERLFGFQ